MTRARPSQCRQKVEFIDNQWARIFVGPPFIAPPGSCGIVTQRGQRLRWRTGNALYAKELHLAIEGFTVHHLKWLVSHFPCEAQTVR